MNMNTCYPPLYCLYFQLPSNDLFWFIISLIVSNSKQFGICIMFILTSFRTPYTMLYLYLSVFTCLSNVLIRLCVKYFKLFFCFNMCCLTYFVFFDLLTFQRVILSPFLPFHYFYFWTFTNEFCVVLSNF